MFFIFKVCFYNLVGSAIGDDRSILTPSTIVGSVIQQLCQAPLRLLSVKGYSRMDYTIAALASAVASILCTLLVWLMYVTHVSSERNHRLQRDLWNGSE